MPVAAFAAEEKSETFTYNRALEAEGEHFKLSSQLYMIGGWSGCFDGYPLIITAREESVRITHIDAHVCGSYGKIGDITDDFSVTNINRNEFAFPEEVDYYMFDKITVYYETCEEDGHVYDGGQVCLTCGKDYYKCDCGALFEDADGNTPIENLAAWKAEGGNGYIAPLPYTIGDILATVEDFPTTNEAGWKTEDGSSCCKIGEILCFMSSDPEQTLSFNFSDTVSLSGTDYLYDSGRNKITFKMEDGVLKSITFNTLYPNFKLLNGTYAPVAYKIIKGADQTVDVNADNVAFSSDAEFSKFVRVEVDEKIVDPSNYEAKSGSTVVTLKKAYISTLKPGKHTLNIVSSDGSAKTKFTIVETPPETGDQNAFVLWCVLLLAAGSAFAGMTVYRRRVEE